MSKDWFQSAQPFGRYGVGNPNNSRPIPIGNAPVAHLGGIKGYIRGVLGEFWHLGQYRLRGLAEMRLLRPCL